MSHVTVAPVSQISTMGIGPVYFRQALAQSYKENTSPHLPVWTYIKWKGCRKNWRFHLRRSLSQPNSQPSTSSLRLQTCVDVGLADLRKYHTLLCLASWPCLSTVILRKINAAEVVIVEALEIVRGSLGASNARCEFITQLLEMCSRSKLTAH